MKKIKLLIYIIPILGLVMTSCDPSVEAPGFDDTSEVTYLPLITLEGGDVTLDCDATSYSDPGAVASAGGNDIELITNVSGAYYGSSSVDGPDVYSVSYSAYNDDGIPATAFREVYWAPCNGDLVTSIAGAYTADIVRNGSTSPQYQGVGPILIKDLGNGVYQISDAIGGYYDFGRGYGPDYAATGMTITANDIPANDFTHDDVVGVGAFGDNAVMTAFSVNAATHTIKFTTDWDAGYVFEVTLTQVQ